MFCTLLFASTKTTTTTDDVSSFLTPTLEIVASKTISTKGLGSPVSVGRMIDHFCAILSTRALRKPFPPRKLWPNLGQKAKPRGFLTFYIVFTCFYYRSYIIYDFLVIHRHFSYEDLRPTTSPTDSPLRPVGLCAQALADASGERSSGGASEGSGLAGAWGCEGRGLV